MKPRTRLAVFFIDKPCYSGPALDLHRSLPSPGVLRAEREVVDALWQAGFDVNGSMHLGRYCTLYLEQCSQVQDL